MKNMGQWASVWSEWTAAKIFIIKCFDSSLLITKSCCSAVQDDRREVHELAYVSEYVSCVGKAEFGEKG